MLRFQRPLLPPPTEWMKEMAPAYEARWFSNGGPVSRAFESRLPAHFGIDRKAVACANATIGLTAALLALDLKGRVAVPSFTFAASAHAVIAAGCEPVLLDVDPETWEMSVENLKGVSDLAGVMAVRAFGFARDLSAMEDWCRARAVPLVVDAAAGVGGSFPNGRPVGSQGDIEIGSLHATKVFAVGEGGIAFCDDPLRDQFARALNFGFDAGVPVHAGLNGKMAEASAAMGMAMLAHIDAHLMRRRELAGRYSAWLARFSGLTVPRDTGECPWQAFPFLLPPGKDPNLFVNEMANSGVESRRYYFPALHQSPCFSKYAHSPLPVAESLSGRMVCLPLYSDMTEDEFGIVLAALEEKSDFFQ